MTHPLIFPVLVLNVVNLFHATFYWKWPASCNDFLKWPISQKYLDNAA